MCGEQVLRYGVASSYPAFLPSETPTCTAGHERNLTLQSIQSIARALDLKISELFRGMD